MLNFDIYDTDIKKKAQRGGVSEELVRSEQEQPNSEDGVRAQSGENLLRQLCI